MSQKNTPSGGSAGIAVFILSVFLSAFLLFQVQPVIARHILPWYGGSPSVWSACMLFFQLGLVVGYGYAHLLASIFRERRKLQIGIHFALVLLALLTLPITPDPGMKPEAGEAMPLAGIILLLGRTVGIPYVILSASGPLVQHWFSRIHPDRSPYRLYAVSNLGSLLALLSYPFLFEVYLTVSAQSLLWSFGFGLYALVLGGTAYVFLKARAGTSAGKPAAPVPVFAKPVVPPGATHFLRWVLLSACGSILLLAVTNHICQDIAVVPFLWILPLSLYLLSFIIAFDHPRWYFRPVAIPALAASIGLALNIMSRNPGLEEWGIVAQIAVFSGALFFSCLACHGEIVRLKPAPRFLTEFYLAISIGGALGGVFVNLIAPAVFDSYRELHIGILMLAALLTWQILPGLFSLRSTPSNPGKRSPFRIAAAVLGCILWFAAVGLAAIVLRSHTVNENRNVSLSSRGFFGVLKVKEMIAETGQKYRVLVHGQIQHGMQIQSPRLSLRPTTYYSRESGIGTTFGSMPQRLGLRNDPLHVGVIGLGVGTVAAYASPGDRFRFYEINRQVIDIANSNFTYLADCKGDVTHVLGDGRISLERELAQGRGNGFDILIIDAFSGDSIPMHLLTAEAFDLYLEHLNDDGVLAFHVSNNHLDLSDPLRNLAAERQLVALRMDSNPMTGPGATAVWVVITRNAEFLDEILALDKATPWIRKKPKGIRWTDDFSNLFQALK